MKEKGWKGEEEESDTDRVLSGLHFGKYRYLQINE